MNVLLAQLCPVPADPAANAARAAEVVAAAPESELAVFPELFLSGYDLGAVDAAAITLDAAELAVVADAAAQAGTAVVIGFAERAGSGVANSLAAIDREGRLAAVYRKVQLFGDERDVFLRGEHFVVVDLAGWAVGLQLCFDAEFPEPARELARAGAELLVTAAANMEPYAGDHDLAMRARALDNRLPHVYVNRVGAEAGLRFVGGSRAIGPDGTVELESAGDGEWVATASVEPRPVSDAAVQYLAYAPFEVPVHVIDAVSGGST